MATDADNGKVVFNKTSASVVDVASHALAATIPSWWNASESALVHGDARLLQGVAGQSVRLTAIRRRTANL